MDGSVEQNSVRLGVVLSRLDAIDRNQQDITNMLRQLQSQVHEMHVDQTRIGACADDNSREIARLRDQSNIGDGIIAAITVIGTTIATILGVSQK